jgi:HAD superfamily hydrolase (TIGR01509 family)
VDAIIFDCDGVLVDSETICVDAELRFLADAGVEFERAAYIQEFMGLTVDEWRTRLGPQIAVRTGRPVAADFFASLDAVVMRTMSMHLTALPGIREAVASLDLSQCVASSTALERLTWKLQHTGLLDLFAPHVFSAEMVANGKPAPDLFLHAAAMLGVDPSHCVVVEDSVNGVLAGRAAGMAVIGFTAGGHCLDGHGESLAENGADVVIDAFADLESAVGQLRSVRRAHGGHASVN